MLLLSILLLSVSSMAKLIPYVILPSPNAEQQSTDSPQWAHYKEVMRSMNKGRENEIPIEIVKKGSSTTTMTTEVEDHQQLNLDKMPPIEKMSICQLRKLRKYLTNIDDVLRGTPKGLQEMVTGGEPQLVKESAAKLPPVILQATQQPVVVVRKADSEQRRQQQTPPPDARICFPPQSEGQFSLSLQQIRPAPLDPIKDRKEIEGGIVCYYIKDMKKLNQQ